MSRTSGKQNKGIIGPLRRLLRGHWLAVLALTISAAIAGFAQAIALALIVQTGIAIAGDSAKP